MAPDTKYAEFTVDWKIRLADYDRIGKELSDIRHYFVTSFENVSFRWYAAIVAFKKHESIVRFCVFYDGPLDKIGGVIYKIGFLKHDRSLVSIHESAREYARGVHRWIWPAFEDKDLTDVRTKYGLTERDHLTYQITIKIPIETFAYSIPSPAPSVCAPWSINLFTSINNGEGSSPPADTKVAGRDGVVFECHKLFVAAQSKALGTIFKYPPLDQDESAGEQPKASAMDEHSTTAIEHTNDDVYDFPNLSAPSLKSLLEYLYTGKPTIATLTVTELIEMGDAGEQYDLNTLKQFCIAELWNRVVIEDPASAFEIARFADLHDGDSKYLKHRALDVIAENYERLGVEQDELAKTFGGTRGKELARELVKYMGRRLRPKISG